MLGRPGEGDGNLDLKKGSEMVCTNQMKQNSSRIEK